MAHLRWRIRRTWPGFLLAFALALASCGGGGKRVASVEDEDVGAQLACESVQKNWAKVAVDPAAYPGEAGEIVGYAGSADDPGLREAAEAFDRDPSVETWDRFKTRCDELGLT